MLSSILLAWITLASMAQAHEVLPAIADMTSTPDQVTFEIRSSLESFVAGVDLAETSDTNESPQAATYDDLRALSPDALAAQFRAFWPDMADNITLLVDGEPLTPVLQTVSVPAVGDVELVRTSTFTFTADLPAGSETLQMGWTPAYGVLVLRQMDVPAPYDGYLEGGALSDPIDLAGGGQASAMESFLNYIPVGFDHIVPKGLDHILFVLALFFLAARARPLILQISLFTVAHTITLALAALGYVNLPGNIVEPLIAASIVFVAVENLWADSISRWRPFIIFGFGLLHGLGFASVLGEFGLPEGSFIPALIGFNVGVEVGQLFVIAIVFLCVWQALRIDRGENEVGRGFAIYLFLLVSAIALSVLNPAGLVQVLENPVWVFGAPLAALFALCMVAIQMRDQVDAYRRIVAVPASLAIAFVGAYWFVERVFL
ncbi:HupE/UreJ family protein [Yoonia litorea]|uniref:HupE / UreJ protein n=1 Tax=Yoonia litorea TaxID=1123755 RepID=A0A1I6M444_9RHOB|nr:HupE/UreJ family protein [Yoonia litorea]SFS10507.1 HupE / UreJ protein [Yoonia litorea]